MKLFSFFLLLILIFEVQLNINNTNTQQNNNQQKKIGPPKNKTVQQPNKINNPQQKANQTNTNNNKQNTNNNKQNQTQAQQKQQSQNQNKNQNKTQAQQKQQPQNQKKSQTQTQQKQQPQNQKKNQTQAQQKQQTQNKNQNQNQKEQKPQEKKIQNQKNNNQNNSTNQKHIEIPKKADNGRGRNPNEQKKEDEKPFNLTESLINFFKETFGNNTEKDKGKNDSNIPTNEKMEQMKIRREAEMQQKIIQERERKRREEFEARAKAELIKIENQKKEEKRKKEQERRDFENILLNTTFDESIQISLEKDETETLYFDLDKFTKIKIAVVLTDVEEYINFVALGPNEWGHNSILWEDFDKNHLFFEHEAKLKGEYLIQITNRGNSNNELIVLVNEQKNKKKDNIDTQKIDKISMLLNTIDNNINELRNKKKLEIKKINKNNEKVVNYNRSIVVYSIIEIFTMIIVFVVQSLYITSIVSKL